MSVLVAIIFVLAIGWVFAKNARRSGAPGQPSWPGEMTGVTAPPDERFTATAVPPPSFRAISAPADAPAPTGLAALTRAQEAPVTGPTRRYSLSSQPQRRRPDRSARLYAQARGPGLLSPRGGQRR